MILCVIKNKILDLKYPIKLRNFLYIIDNFCK